MLEMELGRKWKMAGGIWLAGSENLNLESSGMNGIGSATGRSWMMVSLRQRTA